ncbi:UNVERIFIED_CONTAM: Retrovirus-related Pol polyprotein from transposon RE2 [Sesamum latifolium]|uniref:Retrovirus-related Pol polyprotein from transposon RE2 n=1 Tax=Sesamum latifolium TaxID=2727402 RepID=A0AAW2VWP2_9LAMI
MAQLRRYKARMVAKGFNQVEGVDYTDSFSPVAKTVTVRVFLLLLLLAIHQLDVNNAFLHGHLDEDIYMTPPEGYSSAHDHCLFTWQTASGLVMLLVYVDDILVTGPCLANIQLVKEHLHQLFTIKDIGVARYFLGLEIARVQQLSQFLTHPCDAHWKVALHIVRYLKGSPALGLFFPSISGFELTAYCDADWASCPDSRRSLSRFYIFLGGALVSWKIKKRSTVSRSTAEAEYRSMAATVCELKWLSYVLADFGISVTLPISLFCDNQAALHIMANPVFHERTKHIELDCHVVRDAYKACFVAPSHVRSALQIADLFTKILPLKMFADLVSKLGLVTLSPSPTCGGAVEIQQRHDVAAIVDRLQLKVAGENEDEDEDVLDTG